MFNTATVLLYTCLYLLILSVNPQIASLGRELGLEESRLPATTGRRPGAMLLLRGISPVLELSKNPRYFLKLNSLSLAII